jgi:hypothetical protein
MSCPECQKGPKGIEGHHAIVIDPFATKKDGAAYRCTTCGETYTRAYEGSGVFIWVKTTGQRSAPT